ncbi:MAG: gliding motility-associated C-terminal domain-containing protein [Saprospiraceae bacterium]|nr:gliding motility-associated C-terminal domain-containing protein [Saprospiraceae bacterium]
MVNANCECAGTPDPNYCAALNLFIGNVCNDNDPNTFNDVVNANCECAGTPDPNYCFEKNDYVGSPCDDGNENTQNDSLDADCNCVGSIIQQQNEWILANVIMPEGPVENQFLTIHVTQEAVITFSIRNRWGNIITSLEQEMTEGRHTLWDGRMNGSIQDPGVYVYFLKIEMPSSETIIKQGTVTLIR